MCTAIYYNYLQLREDELKDIYVRNGTDMLDILVKSGKGLCLRAAA